MKMLLLPLLAALAACATTTAPTDGVVEAGIGETARFGAVTVRPTAVLEDSRCPEDVECIWAGRVRISAAISGVPGASELTLGWPFALPGGGAIRFVSATPEHLQVPLPGTNPRFGFRRESYLHRRTN